LLLGDEKSSEQLSELFVTSTVKNAESHGETQIGGLFFKTTL